MQQGLAITFVGLLQIMAMISAFFLGKQTERPEKQWPTGSLLKGGWKAWRIPLMVIIGVALLFTVVLPLLNGLNIGRVFSGMAQGASGGWRSGGGGGGGGQWQR